MRAALIGLGSNLAEPLKQVAQAVEALPRLGGSVVLSSVFRTSPVGYLSQPDFLNIVALVSTDFTPEALLLRLQEIEERGGRSRTIPNGPRTIDVDLLDLEGIVMDMPALTLPHPRMHTRRFVLEPLVEIMPDWRHPTLQRTARELLAALPEGEGVRRMGALPELLEAGSACTTRFEGEQPDGR